MWNQPYFEPFLCYLPDIYLMFFLLFHRTFRLWQTVLLCSSHHYHLFGQVLWYLYTNINKTEPYKKCFMINHRHWLCTSYLKSVFSNTYFLELHLLPGKSSDFRTSSGRQPSRRWKMLLKIDFKTVNTVLSQTFNYKICFE